MAPRKRRAAAPPKPSPPARARMQRPLVALMLVAGILVVGFLGWRAIDAGLDLRGEAVLVIEKSPDIPGAFVLNATRTQEEFPAFLPLLDEAWLGGKSTTNNAELVGQVRAYMDSLAREQGHDQFEDPPFENVLVWGEREDAKALRLIYFTQ